MLTGLIPPHQSTPFRPEGGDLLISYLEQIGVEYVFGVPGGAIEPLYNALARSARRGGPRAVVARHETGAAFMADGYARESGGLGVCCATTGPGATNLITGVASAYQNHIPLLVITAQTALPRFGQGALQESSCTGVNIVGMFEHCTYYNSMVSHLSQLEPKLISAIMCAWRSRGPAHLSIPCDILRAHAPQTRAVCNLNNLLRVPALVDVDAIERLHRRLRQARKPVLLIGGGCSEAAGTILDFARLINAPVLATPHGKGLVHPYHPCFKGVFGFAGHHSAQKILHDDSVDLVLAVGTVLGEWDSGGWDEQTILNQRLVHIDATPEYFSRSPMACLHVEGRILTVFERLVEYYKNREGYDDMTRVASYPPPQLSLDTTKWNSNAVPIKPQRLMRELSHLFPFNTRFLVDAGNSLAWAIHYLHPCKRWRLDNKGEPNV